MSVKYDSEYARKEIFLRVAKNFIGNCYKYRNENYDGDEDKLFQQITTDHRQLAKLTEVEYSYVEYWHENMRNLKKLRDE